MLKLCSVIDHQNKSRAYRDALAAAGYSMTERRLVNGLRFILTDADWRWTVMANAAELHTPVFLYPHAARPMVQYDGCVTPQPVTAMFTQAEGGKRIMEKIGYPYPVEVSGWAFSEVRPFRHAKQIRKICYAPIHPNANGYLNAVDKDLNRRTLARLVGWCQTNDARLSVRWIDSPEACGIPELKQLCAQLPDLVEAHKGKKNNSTDDMLTADLVVSHQTFAWIAVALGIPTVMMGEDVPPRSGNSEAGFCYVAHWDDYKTDLMYPLDILAGDPAEAIEKAASGSEAVEAWKQRLIGVPFDGPAFVKKLESYL